MITEHSLSPAPNNWVMVPAIWYQEGKFRKKEKKKISEGKKKIEAVLKEYQCHSRYLKAPWLLCIRMLGGCTYVHSGGNCILDQKNELVQRIWVHQTNFICSSNNEDPRQRQANITSNYNADDQGFWNSWTSQTWKTNILAPTFLSPRWKK